jgi:hypothetical protein
LKNRSHRQNLSSTSGEPEFVAQKFFEISVSVPGIQKSVKLLWNKRQLLGKMVGGALRI